MKTLSTVVCFVSLILTSLLSAQTPEQLQKWQTPSFELLKEKLKVITNQKNVHLQSAYSDFERNATKVVALEPNNPLLYYTIGIMNNERMQRVPQEVGISNPQYGFKVDDLTQGSDIRSKYKALYTIQEESSRLVQENLLKAGDLGFTQAYSELAAFFRGNHAQVGSLERFGFTRWDPEVNQKLVDLLQRGIRAGNEVSRQYLAELYIKGEGEIQQNIPKGEEIANNLRKPSEFYFWLASQFLTGKEKREQPWDFNYSQELGAKYMKKAADIGHKDAQFYLAKSYLRIPGSINFTPEDPQRGFSYMSKVATSAKEAPAAYYELALLIWRGKGTQKNNVKALEMIEELYKVSKDPGEKAQLERKMLDMSYELMRK